MGRCRGFTLIELLVVIAVVAMLAAIFFPVFAQVRSKARAASCLSTLKQWGTAALMYTQDYDDRFPRMFREVKGWNPGALGSRDTGWSSEGYYWHQAIYPYVKSYDMLHCPETQGALNIFCLPYGWNKSFIHDNSLAEYPSPAETIVIADGRGRLTLPSDRSDCQKRQPKINQPCADCLDNGRYIYGHLIVPPAVAARDPSRVDLNANYPVSSRHHGRANMIFMAGHAAAIEAGRVNRCNNYWDGDGGIGGECRVGDRHPRFSR